MIDLTWKLFSQTGNIETYLLLKELEKSESTKQIGQLDVNGSSSLNTKI